MTDKQCELFEKAKISKHFAVSDHDSDEVCLVVERIDITNDNGINGYVINGGYSAVFYQDYLLIEEDMEKLPYKILWAGRLEGKNYNEQIAWVSGQLRNNEEHDEK